MIRTLVALLTAAALAACGGGHLVRHPVAQGNSVNSIGFEYDGTDYTWRWQDQPHKQAHVDIYYSNGHPAFLATVTLSSDTHPIPDPPEVVGCGWQRWIVYAAPGMPNWRHTPHPPTSTVLARGKLYVCRV